MDDITATALCICRDVTTKWFRHMLLESGGRNFASNRHQLLIEKNSTSDIQDDSHQNNGIDLSPVLCSGAYEGGV
ncbi:hypothetical protein EB796_017794 [Bugula neritina]|uniref:Uncharacterized protein n=1 Tax=Bugula neritina TaxID=10212 RepID=A0A7J7JCY3_BUGNE|nr:hypothetical protein EB796_017794 [Bugula neritina]